MQQSFKNRMAALERLEAQQEALANPGKLTVEDCATLVFQIVLWNISIQADGRAVRNWECGGAEVNVALDRALLRLNYELAGGPEEPCTLCDLAVVLAQYVPDEALPDWVWSTLFERYLPLEGADEAHE